MSKTRSSLYYWNGQDMYVGMFPNNAEHRHHVLQIQIGINRSFRLQADGASYEYRAVIIAPNVPHRVDDHNEWQMMLHIDPESLSARQLLATYLVDRRFKEIEFRAVKSLLPPPEPDFQANVRDDPDRLFKKQPVYSSHFLR